MPGPIHKSNVTSEPAALDSDDERTQTSQHTIQSRKSPRQRHSPTRFIARPSKQGLNVEDGDAIFLLSQLPDSKRDAVSSSPPPPSRNGTTAKTKTTTNRRMSHRLAQQNTVKERMGKSMEECTIVSEGGRVLPMREARFRSRLSQQEYHLLSSTNTKNNNNNNNKHSNETSPKRPNNVKKRPISEVKHDVNKAPRPPRVIVIGAGISGLACARELSERRHNVLVLEARNRIGGRLRTVDLMMERVDVKRDDIDGGGGGDAIPTTELLNVRKWSPVDVGGAFIHGTGQITTTTDDSVNVGSHDFGTSRGKSKHVTQQPTKDAKPVRKSSRLSSNYDRTNSRKSHKETALVNNRNLNPVFVLANRKLRLPVQAVEGAFTCLVDYDGNLISREVDEDVSREFNDVLDLATKCCESGMMPVIGEMRGTAPSEQLQVDNEKYTGIKSSSKDGASPNYVSDDTSPDIDVDPDEINEEPQTSNNWKKINPNTDFGTIFEECRKYNDAVSNSTRSYSPKEREIRHHLFQWHVANLEMSSGAPMNKLGQRWNDDEPFGYGGDHSYLEGGFRAVIEALAEGFDCRGVGDRSMLKSKEWIRRSGDLAGNFSVSSSSANTTTSQTRGIIQCGVEVVGVEVVEKDEAKMRRKRSRLRHVDLSKCRRSTRENKGSKMSTILGSLTRHHNLEASNEPQIELTEETERGIVSSTYGNEQSTVVRVTTKCGLTLEADAVVVTLPLAILSIPPGSPGHVSFSPPLSEAKQNALRRLGVGTYNKCCMSFERPFWKHLPRHLSSSSSAVPSYWNDPTTHRFDFIGHASTEHGKDILFFNIRNAPILVAIYGGSDYSEEMEKLHDKEVVAGCMEVLKKIFSKATDDCRLTRSQISDLTVPDWPVDYFVSRWGSDPYSRGAFSYVPEGVDGFEELFTMSQPIYDFHPGDTTTIKKPPIERPRRPLIMFAGEATTPFHPSTLHGAFETGIREAYRLDFALEPGLNGFDFDESYLYQPTFSVRLCTADSKSDKRGLRISTQTDVARHRAFTAEDDASILRGFETYSLSSIMFQKIKKQMLDPGGTSTVTGIRDRFNVLRGMIVGEQCDPKSIGNSAMKLDESTWEIPGDQQGTWLAPEEPKDDVEKNSSKHKPTSSTLTNPSERVQIVHPPRDTHNNLQSRFGRKIQRKCYMDCIEYS
eukprot:CCRYP_006114-RA/>CCRYP_006114-RA protein AED:0.02 eAED:0.02 QI:122/1/1/1/0.5/0.33/3/81/1174